jgi:hypothetical protein
MFHGVFRWSKKIDKDRIPLNPLVDTHFPHRDCQFRGKHPFQTLFFLAAIPSDKVRGGRRLCASYARGDPHLHG